MRLPQPCVPLNSRHAPPSLPSSRMVGSATSTADPPSHVALHVYARIKTRRKIFANRRRGPWYLFTSWPMALVRREAVSSATRALRCL
eukprot:5186159-Prymnesium_polylepis.1